ncbi:SDR family oxidoreductase [Actinoplanes sp. NPDC049596]|uniref:SDR family oxidoreductase n=1 Tax=unclassified Actinoplanes TaxID=2626549 RepID=UPI0034495F22
MDYADHRVPRGTGAHLVTGATGFVGRALVLELLARTAAPVVCLVRAADDQDAQRRLQEALREAAGAYGAEAPVREAIATRCHAVHGDLAQDLGHVAAGWAGSVDQVWHCAASLRFLERDRALIERVNVDGTVRLLGLAAQLRATAFHYMSTAYVVGEATGEIRAAPVETATANNVYEESKLEAERAVLGFASAGIRVTVLRPSIVVGHSRTYAVSGTRSGFYGLAAALERYHDREDLPPGPVRVLAPSDGTFDLVPVDQVAREAVLCGLRGEPGGIYHLTSGRPLPVPVVLAAITRTTEVAPVALVGDAGDLRSPVEQRLGRTLGFYRVYMHGDKRFDRRRTDAIAGPAAAVDEVFLERLLGPPQGAEAKRTVVIVGGGYASFAAYRALRRRMRRAIGRGDVRVVIVAPGARHSFHGWTGEVIAGTLDRSLLESSTAEISPGAEVVEGRVTLVALADRQIGVEPDAGGRERWLAFDHLVLAAGAVGRDLPGAGLTPGQLAERSSLVTAGAGPVVVVGGGFAGVETAAAIAERWGRERRAGGGVTLMQSGDVLIPELMPRYARLDRYVRRRLSEAGVTVRTSTKVVAVTPDGVHLADGSAVPAALVVTAVGRRPVALPGTEGLDRRPDGRLVVDRRLRVPGAERVWAVGDDAAVPRPFAGGVCPPNALWALKQGAVAGRNIARGLKGRGPVRFTYPGLGRAGSLGRGQGFMHLYGVPVTGRLAWLLRAVLFAWFMPSRRQGWRALRALLTG